MGDCQKLSALKEICSYFQIVTKYAYQMSAPHFVVFLIPSPQKERYPNATLRKPTKTGFLVNTDDKF